MRTELLRRMSAFAFATLLLVFVGCGGDPPEDSQDTQDAVVDPSDPNEILNKTLAAYRDAKAYSDRGALYLTEIRGDDKGERPAVPFSVALRPPNQLQVIIGFPADHNAAIIGESIVVSDGEKMRTRTEAQREILEVVSPASIEIAHVHKAVDDSVVGRTNFPNTRLQLLLGSEKLDAIFPGLSKAEMLESQKIDEHLCWRISLPMALGPRIYWVDQKSFILRRVDFSADESKQAFAWHQVLNIDSARFEFADAKFEVSDDIERYRMNVTDDALLVREWLPPAPDAIPELLGQTVEDFSFSDLDEKDTTAKSLAEKIVVIDFWASLCKPCLESLPKLNPLVAKYKDNPQVQFMAVSTDEPNVSNDSLRKIIASNNIDMPIYRDRGSYSRLTFNIGSLPTTLILDGAGKVQMLESPASEQVIESTIESLLDGKDVATERKRQFREAVAQREKFLNKVLVGGSFEQSAERTAAKSDPKRLKFTKLWTCDELIQPGHILVAETPGGAPRIYVHDGWDSISEVGLDGKLAETYELDLADDAPVSTSRTVVDSAGVQHFVAFATRQQQVHVFDNQWKLRFSYPDKDTSHPGIANVLLADLDGDRNAEINISFWGAAGVQSLSFEGKRLWPKRLIKSLEDIRGLAVTAADDKGQRQLIAAHYDPTLATFAYGGERGSDIVVPGKYLFDIAATSFGDDQHKYCALASGADGQISALGINEKGKVLWSQKLPGVPELPVENLSTGMLPTSATQKARHWVLLAPDSSLHFVAADGKMLDQFNYGSELRAVAVIEHDGKSVLLASTPDGVEAWQIDVHETEPDE